MGEAMSFHRPILVGDVVSVYADVVRVGRTSIKVRIETVATRRDGAEPVTMTEGTFVYVAIDDDGNPRPVAK